MSIITKIKKFSLVALLVLTLVLGSGAGAAQAALTFDATSVTGSTTASLVSTTTNAVSVDSGTTGAVNLGTGASAKTITVGNAASTEAEINALLVDINAGATGMTIDFGAGNLAITGAGASADFTLDSDLISIDGTGTSNITVTGAAGEDFTIAQAGAADASLFLSSTGTGADALTITVSGASGDIQVDATAGTVIVDGGEAAADALLLRATGGTTATAHLTSNGTGTAAVDIDATGAGGDIDIDAVDAIDLLAGGVFSIDGTGASNVSATSGNLTLSTITTGVLILSSAGNTTLDVAAGGLLSIDVAAPGLEVATANNISVAASDSVGVVAQTLVMELTGAADDEDDFTVRATGAEGDLLLTSGDDLLIDTVGLLELNSSGGVISIGNDAANFGINIGTAGTRTIAIGSATTILNATAKVGSLVNLSAATNTTTAVVNNGLIIPISADCALGITEGQICWDSDNNVLYVGDAAAAAAVAGSTGAANTWTDNQIYTFAGDEDIAITSTATTTTVVPIVANSLTTGIGESIASTATAITGAGRLLYVNHGGATSTNGILSEFTTAATDETVVLRVSSAAMIDGVNLSVVGTTGMTTGSLIRATTSTAGLVATNGIVSIRGTGAHTSTANAGLLDVQSSGVVGTAANGTLVNFQTTAAAQVDTTVLNVENSGFTTGYTGSMLRIKSVTTDGAARVVDLIADGITSGGTAMKISTTALTTGDGLLITNGTSAITTGSLLNVTASGTGTIATDGVVKFSHAGIYGSTSNAGFVNITANATTAGTVLAVNATGLVDGIGIFSPSAEAGLTTGKYLSLGGVFTVAKYGATVISGTAEGTAALTLTTGDIVVTDGDLTLTAGDASFGEDVAVTGLITTTGGLTSGAVNAVTGVDTLTSADCGKITTVTAGIDTATITLPEASTVLGCTFTIMYIGADAGALLDISPLDSDADGIDGTCTLAASVVTLSGTADADIGFTKATIQTGDTMKLTAVGAAQWIMHDVTGICANN